MSTATPATLWLRLAAAVYDLFPLIGLWMLTSGVILLTVHGSVDVAHPPLSYRLALQIALLIVTAAYFIVSWTRGGQTIGMRAWRLRVVANDGRRLPFMRATLRFATALVSLLVFGLGFIACLVTVDRRGWHDRIAASQVVRVAD
jgi:uncharacterized RDD family membrane protein YckC